MKNDRTRDIAVVFAVAVAAVFLALLFLRSNMNGMMFGAVIGLALAPLALSRPAWALLFYVAIPPGLLATSSGAANMALLVPIVLITLSGLAFAVGRHSVGDTPLAPAYGALLALMGLSYLLGRVTDAVGITPELLTFTSYAALYLLVVNMAPGDPAEGRTYVRALHDAVLVSMLATGAIALTQFGGSLLSGFSLQAYPEQPGLMYNRTHFGYLMALGLAVALPRWALRVGRTALWGVLSIASSAMVVLSLTRGGWAAALLTALIVAFAGRRRSILLAIPAGIVLSFVPVIHERLFSDFAGGVLFAVQNGSAGSYRILLWQVLVPLALAAPWFGHGFGFMTTVSPELYFGERQFVTSQNPLLYAHNDLLYLLIELGVLGLALYIAGLLGWWAHTISSMKQALGRKDPELLALVLTCVGAGVVILVAQMADNAFFIRALFERFAVFAATAWVLRSAPPLDVIAPVGRVKH